MYLVQYTDGLPCDESFPGALTFWKKGKGRDKEMRLGSHPQIVNEQYQLGDMCQLSLSLSLLPAAIRRALDKSAASLETWNATLDRTSLSRVRIMGI